MQAVLPRHCIVEWGNAPGVQIWVNKQPVIQSNLDIAVILTVENLVQLRILLSQGSRVSAVQIKLQALGILLVDCTL